MSSNIGDVPFSVEVPVLRVLGVQGSRGPRVQTSGFYNMPFTIDTNMSEFRRS